MEGDVYPEAQLSPNQRTHRQGLLMGSVREKSTIQCLNIRGLALISNRVKVSTLEDILEAENSIGICLTETWLDDTVSDGEIQMENFEIFRSDRKVRKRGGVALYLRKELHGKSVYCF